ncbi:MAG: cytochrome P450 [Acidimicrobiales bacterium]
MANVLSEANLPATTNPSDLPDGECPWHRYQRAGHDSWAFTLGPSMVVRGHEEARAVLNDRRFVQGITKAMEDTPGTDPRFIERRKQGFLLRDGADHRRMRAIASKAFTPRAADRFRPVMREVMNALADNVPADGRCDAVQTLTHAYPTTVICAVLGAPTADVELFSELTETILNAQAGSPEHLDQALAAHEQLDEYLLRLIAERERAPKEDLLSDLIRAETEEGKLTREEVLSAAASVIMAGTDTTRNQLAIALHLLADHPDHWAALLDEGRLESTVEEVLRFAPIGHVLLRVPTEDVDLHDVTIPTGTMVILDIGGANRDPQLLDGPDDFDPARTTRAQHLGFGHGHKFCLGANLARAELVEALRVLRSRFPTVEHSGPTQWRRVGFVQGPVALPLRFR